MRFSAREIAYLSSSACIGDAVITSAGFDSRKAGPGYLFIATRGAKADGHDFVPSAVEKGASAVLISSERAESLLPFTKGRCAVVIAKDPLDAIRRFASIRAAALNATMIGVTGSCGKTTTKEMIHSILSVSHNAVKTPGNLNSEYGLPLSMLELDEKSEFGVFEIGVDHIGEMAQQASLLSPEYSVITNIGISHLEEFGSQAAIAREKGGILLPQSFGFTPEGGTYNSYFRLIARSLEEVGNPFSEINDLGLAGFALTLGSESFIMPAVGKHNITDASLAVAVARSLGIPDSDIAEGLSRLESIFGRSRVVKEGSLTVIEDCYNATLDSVSDAISTVSRLSWPGRKHIVLGDMRELGDMSVAAHREVGYALSKADCDNIYLYGEEIRETYSVLAARCRGRKKVVYTPDFEKLSDYVVEGAHSGDLMLLKGSRIMAMERLFPTLRQVV